MKAKPKDARSTIGKTIAISSLATLAFFALVALAAAYGGSAGGAVQGQPSATLPETRLLSGFVVIGVPALAAWGVSIHHRCISVSIRNILLAIDAAMIVWLCAACVVTEGFGITEPPLMAIAVLTDLALALVIEIYIEARILPSIHRYRTLFRRLPFDLKILNEGGRVIYKTDIAHSLDNTTLWQLVEQKPAGEAGSASSLRSASLPNYVFKPYRLSAGMALLTEDATESNRLQQRLEERQRQLTTQNEILRHNHAMQSLLYRQQREHELGMRVEEDLASTATQIRDILDNRVAGTDPEARAERLKQLNLVKVLVAYSKRKGMLALAAAERETFTSEQLEVVAREAMADLHSIGIECALLVDSKEPISIVAFNTVYDCYYDCILSVLPRTDPVMMTYITTREGGVLEMRAVIECAIGLTDANAVELIPQIATSTEPWTAVQTGIARDLESRLATRGVDFTVALDEGLVTVMVHVPSPLAGEQAPEESAVPGRQDAELGGGDA